MKRFRFKMSTSMNSGIMTLSLLCYAILAGLIWDAEAGVIMRREIAAPLQRNDPTEMHSDNNQTITMLTLHTPQNENATKLQSTKLLPQRSGSVTPLVKTAEDSPLNGNSKKITLKMVNDSPNLDTKSGDDMQRLNIELPSTTSAMPNTIEIEQNVKEKFKLSPPNPTAHEKVDIKFEDKVSSEIPKLTSTESAILINTKSDQFSTTFPTTGQPLLEHKAHLSLGDSNEIQISSSPSPKQPKFLNDNSTNLNRLNLPNSADVWTLAGMKAVPPRSNQSNAAEQLESSFSEVHSNKSTLINPVKEKTLTDWTQIVQMGVEKSIENALTDEQHNFNDAKVTPLMMMTTTPHAMLTPEHPTLSNRPLFEENERATTMKSTTPDNTKKSVMPNEMTTLMPVTSAVSSEQSEFLSAIDNVNSVQTLQPNNTRTLSGELTLKNKEKTLSNEEHEKSNSVAENSLTTTTTTKTTTTTTTPPTEATTMKMTTISTPATDLVSTSESTLQEHRAEDRIENVSGNPTNGNSDKNSKNTNEIDAIETTTIVGANSPTTIATNLPIQIVTTTTIRSTILATNVTELINFPSTTRQPSPDIHQISTKSNLETPTTTPSTTTTKTTTISEEATIETTQTESVQRGNSSVITNPTLTQTKEEEHSKDIDVIDATTADSFGAQSTSNIQIEFSTILPPPKTTTTTADGEKINASNASVIETTVATDTSFGIQRSETKITSTTLSAVSTFEKEFDSNGTATTTANTASNGIELPIITSTTTLPPTESKHSSSGKDNRNTTTVEPRRSNTDMNIVTDSAVRESTSTETPLTNFIDDSISTSTKAATTTTTTTVAPNSTISPTTSTSTPVLSVQTTTTDELNFTHIEKVSTITDETPTTSTTTTTTTTPSAAESTAVTPFDVESTTPKAISSGTTTGTDSSTTTTTTTTTTELPTFIPPRTTPTIEIATITTEKTIEMVPTVVTQSTHFEAAPSMPVSTTVHPLIFPDNANVLHAQPPKSSPDAPETDVNVVIAISVSVIGVVALILLVAFLYLMRKRAKATSYGQRCRPVSLDAYSLDNVSVLGSVRRKSALRASKRSYGNAAFDDPSLRHNILQTAADLAKFVERRSSIFEEFRDVPQIIARPEEIPEGCENKNRYANVIPLPETRVILQRRNDDDTTEYINANYVRGPKDAPNYYIACQAPLDSTVQDFWRMIWEQQSRVIIQATDLIENGVEKCAEYLPPSITLDNHTTFGDFQVTLKNREVKDKYAISTVLLKDTISNTSREITHYWYKWPEIGVPSEEAPIIAMLLEARSSLKSYALEVTNELKEKSNLSLEPENNSGDAKSNGAGPSSREINGNVSEKSKNISRNQGPLTIHCSPGTGRTGTIIACDIAIRSLETTKSLDIPQIVYYIRRGRASAIQTKEQYEFIYKVSNVYAMKITNVPNDN